MNLTKSESAVSPVIGTILLVAIVVVLVAIILVVVMGFSGDTNEKKVGLNAKPASGNDAMLILYGGTSIDELVKLEMIDQDSPIGEYVKFWDISEDESAYVGIPYLAGNVARPLESMDIYDTRINVKGTFSDGTDVILLVQPMTFGNVEGPKVPAVPSKIAEYVQKVSFQGVDITDNHGQTTTGFTATYHPKYFTWDGFGASIEGYSITVQLVDQLPREIGYVRISNDAVTPGRITRRYDSNDVYINTGGAIGSAKIKNGSGWAGGVGGNPTGLWKITVDVRDTAGKSIASDIWYVEATVP